MDQRDRHAREPEDGGVSIGSMSANVDPALKHFRFWSAPNWRGQDAATRLGLV